MRGLNLWCAFGPHAVGEGVGYKIARADERADRRAERWERVRVITLLLGRRAVHRLAPALPALTLPLGTLVRRAVVALGPLRWRALAASRR